MAKKKKSRRENGQAMVEMAIIIPILITLLCGVIDFGWIFVNEYKVQDAAYEGARYASINSEKIGGATLQSEIEKQVKGNLWNEGKGSKVTIDDKTEGSISVTVEYPVPVLTFVAQTFFGKTYNAKSTSVAPR